ncbi:SsgA family sporulation/cell division regulator [Kitasatospora sp. NPDC057542]|uniref:SsgA family sporulation/cell division regulator n=1 Tax=Streptomycetaceae TaxID=2062 RepID=UPI001CCDB272|nr:SsgA family sporulation/cell division regulator [Streptomyces sp. LS1784]
MELLLPSGEPVTLPTLLSYRSYDPLAVRIVFHTDAHGRIPWVFARDLPAQGLHRPSGQGDVQVWPGAVGHEEVLNLAFSSPEGTAWLRAPLHVVAEWLERTHRLVPAGQEADRYDLDAELSCLLPGTRPRPRPRPRPLPFSGPADPGGAHRRSK